MIKAIVFDFDGVIAESVDIKTKAFAKLFENQGKEVVKQIVDYHLNNTGVSRQDKFRYIHKNIIQSHLSDRRFKQLCNDFARIVVVEVINAPYVIGAKEFLEKYSDRYMCFICSATPQSEIIDIIQKRSINSYFKGVYGSPSKKEDIVRDIIVKESIKPSETVYVGDALSDYSAAENNAVKFIARMTSDNKHLFDKIDCVKIKDLSGLFGIINKI
ncbi:MAG: HAD family hydrolase [Planctomycetes bacterium]|nr:HAD family hydrolase [Planctomycetota bacterium]